jgi:hypothetical protein
VTISQDSEFARDNMEHAGELVAQTLELHDVDNNLIKSDELTKILNSYFEEAGGSTETLREIQREIEESGGSFDTLAEMRRLYDNDSPGLVDEVMGRLVEDLRIRKDLPYDDPNCLFLPGARELIAQQPPTNILRAFVTRGGEEFQEFKLQYVLGIDMQQEMYAILPLGSKETKADMCIESFRPDAGGTGEFLFRWLHNAPEAGVRVQSVLVTDDKARELLGLERLGKDKAIGLWHRTGDRKSQRLPEGKAVDRNIFEIRSFQEVGQFWRRLGTKGMALAMGGTQDWALRNRI